MLFVEKEKLINELKKARRIKAGQGFKISLYEKLAEADADFLVKFNHSPAFIKEDSGVRSAPSGNLFMKSPVFAPLALVAAIIVLIGGGAGMTLASQSSLPGDILYPIKIASEKTRIVLASDNNEKAKLHLEFSARRLNEVAELAKDISSDPKLAESVAGEYKKELNEAQNILFSNEGGEKIEEAAGLLEDITSKNKEIIAIIGIEAKNRGIIGPLKDALEETIEHNDRAVLIALKNNLSEEASSSAVDFRDLAMESRVIKKIAEAERKIAETEKYLLKKEEKGIDVSAIKAEIDNAKKLAGEAKNLLSQAQYESAFSKAKEAKREAAAIKEIIENLDDGDDDDNEDEIEDFKYYYLPDIATSSDVYNLNSTTSAVFNQTANIFDKIDILEDRDDKKSDENNEKRPEQNEKIRNNEFREDRE